MPGSLGQGQVIDDQIVTASNSRETIAPAASPANFKELEKPVLFTKKTTDWFRRRCVYYRCGGEPGNW